MGGIDLAFTILRLALFLAVGAGYTAVGWFTFRRWHLPGLTLLWACSSAVFGVVSFRIVCGRPLTCDVGIDPYSSYYLTHVASFYALVGATGFLVASTFILVRLRSSVENPRRTEDLVIGGVATTAGWILGGFLAPTLLSW